MNHPATIAFSRKALLNFVDQNPFTFLKPVHGSKGEGIIEIHKSDKFYLTSYQIKAGGAWQHKQLRTNRKNLVKIIQHVMEELGQKERYYLIQQGVHVLFYEKQKTDFRVSAHRGREGRLEVVVVVVRLGGNISQSGSIASENEVLGNSK